MPEGHRHLTHGDGCQIGALKESGLSDGATAARPGRDRSSVWREPRRNGGGSGYSAGEGEGAPQRRPVGPGEDDAGALGERRGVSGGRRAAGCSRCCAAAAESRTGVAGGARAVATSRAGWTSPGGRMRWRAGSVWATGRRTRPSGKATAGRWSRSWTAPRNTRIHGGLTDAPRPRSPRRCRRCRRCRSRPPSPSTRPRRTTARGSRATLAWPGRSAPPSSSPPPPLPGAWPEREHQRAGAAVPAEGDGPAGGHRRGGESGAGPPERATAQGARLPDARRGVPPGPPSLTRPARPRRCGWPRRKGWNGSSRRVRPDGTRTVPGPDPPLPGGRGPRLPAIRAARAPPSLRGWPVLHFGMEVGSLSHCCCSNRFLTTRSSNAPKSCRLTT